MTAPRSFIRYLASNKKGYGMWLHMIAATARENCRLHKDKALSHHQHGLFLLGNAILLARLIGQGKLDRVLAGGVDALTLFTLNGFNSLMILDRNACMPFDENRNGLNLGEGAGFLVLESEETAIRENKKIYGLVKGGGNACDAYHQTASSPEGQGAFLSMQLALAAAGLAPEEISYINAHGTGTKNNDLSEGVALERIFVRYASVQLSKSFTGQPCVGGIEAYSAFGLASMDLSQSEFTHR
jgi:3-oxoacyl-[acyl-carrier-protein] synthase-1